MAKVAAWHSPPHLRKATMANSWWFVLSLMDHSEDPWRSPTWISSLGWIYAAFDRFGPFVRVTSHSSVGDFLLVVSFSRSSIRLDEGSVALISNLLLVEMPPASMWCTNLIGFSDSRCLPRTLVLWFVYWINLCAKILVCFSPSGEMGVVIMSKRKRNGILSKSQNGTLSRSTKQSYVQLTATPPFPHHRSRKIFTRLSHPSSYYKNNFEKDSPPCIYVFQCLSRDQHDSRDSHVDQKDNLLLCSMPFWIVIQIVIFKASVICCRIISLWLVSIALPLTIVSKCAPRMSAADHVFSTVMLHVSVGGASQKFSFGPKCRPKVHRLP